MTTRRIAVVRVPDWSVEVARAAGELPGGVPVATAHLHRIVACDDLARAAGVRVGQRVRDAQAGAPSLVLSDADAVGEVLAFAHVIRAVESVVPGVQGLGDGALALPMRGAARFYGGEREAVAAIVAALAPLGLRVRVGVADDRFTAELAERVAVEEPHRAPATAAAGHEVTRSEPSSAYRTRTPAQRHLVPEVGASPAEADGQHPAPIRIVDPGASRAFLAPVPVTVLGGELAGMLLRLGLRTLGDLAALPDASVRDRFGAEGLRDLQRARGLDDRRVEPGSDHPPDALALEFEPGIEGGEELGFALQSRADAYVAELAARRLVVAEVRILLRADLGGISERTWRKPGFFRARDVVDRARWQLAESGLDSALVEVRITPERLERDTEHMPGLWGGRGVDERTRGVIERLQGVLGREGVVVASLGGGRLLAERGVLTPWGDAVAEAREGPWPGSLPEPRPATVFRPPQPVVLLDADGGEVGTGERIRPPTWFRTPSGDRRRVAAWAGPWPLRMRAGAHVEALARIQVVDGAGDAWVLLGDAAGWRAEGRYD
ncbi:Y-family DNA polymerase [Agrococcus jejuensis]|uniref:Protein ImuB n=1 Tax=Agrococcus jejuensis TaxID=399736 RepID=A0A1G8BBW6_9MICO|nr:DNA polymerase Y family protein [Agrococcus jejuensis]SDH30717.1 protein ImuB [Agrococcus jejuensis]